MLYFGDNAESRIHRDDPLRGALEYAEHFHCAFLFNPDIRKVLFIGLGGGTGPIQFLHSYPGILIDVAEIDPEVIRIATRFFNLPEVRALRVVQADGRAFVRRTRRRYDLIVVDAYMTVEGRNLIPPHLTTVEFFREARARLTQRGILCYNVIGTPYGELSAMPCAVARTLASVFASVYVFDVQGSWNSVLFATGRKMKIAKKDLVARAKQLHATGSILLPTIVDRAKNLCTRALATQNAPLLTDADAPVKRLIDGEA